MAVDSVNTGTAKITSTGGLPPIGELVFITSIEPYEDKEKAWKDRVSGWPEDPNSQDLNDWIKSVVFLDPGTPVIFMGIISGEHAKILYGERFYKVPLSCIVRRISMTYGSSHSNRK